MEQEAPETDFTMEVNTPEVEDTLEEMVLKTVEPEAPVEPAASPDLFAEVAPEVEDTLKMEAESPAELAAPALGERFTLDDAIENEDLNREADALKITEIPARDNHVVEDRPPREELAARNKEREQRIRELTMKLKTPSGLTDLESEPAYKRRGVALDNTPHSSESSVSRYSLNEEENAEGEKEMKLRDNNPFLHDNVD